MKKQLLMLAMLIILVGYQAQAQDTESDEKKEKINFGTHNDFSIDLGMNNYLQDGSFPDNNDAPYAVKPFGSWYVALKSINDTHVGGALHLLWGPEVSWYNFKFNDEAIRLSKINDQVLFVESPAGIYVKKSKLTVAYLNFSVVPMLKFGDKRDRHNSCWMNWNDKYTNEGFRIGIGSYGGYKIASYSKVVIEEDGDDKKNRDKDSFYLNNFRYGVRFQAGFRGVDVFANYDLNELFVADKGPKLNAFSFGIVL